MILFTFLKVFNGLQRNLSPKECFEIKIFDTIVFKYLPENKKKNSVVKSKNTVSAKNNCDLTTLSR